MTPRIPLPVSHGIEETFDGRRSRHILAGEGMLTPIRPLDVHQDGKTETYYPGSFRCSPDWWGVRDYPEKFRVCMKGDKSTLARHRQLLQLAQRHEQREIDRMRHGTSRHPQTEWRFPARLPRESWRLP
jgi:hypothetical protein